ncbi:UTRA domain-containing protein [Micromonospora sp. KC721]|uniref:UTRA domain-containing protein n=1 Tax=Micromonospora sp. KC721 TaxID=2530380 RepID=UPI001045357D|nr:UTRA domain-containing protein [Micromonospora sp. KC721]TDB71002.1 UTRA domain-containing protein [Micromonospora sp. KC721]
MAGTSWVSVSMPYVCPRSSGEAEAWAEEAASQGGVGTQVLREVTEVAASPEVAERLRIALDTPVVVRRRLMLLDGRPVELTDSCYPASLARGTALGEARKIRGGAVSLLADLGYRPGRVSEDVYTRQPTDAERSALHLTDRDWVLGLTRILSTAEGMPIELSVMTMVPQGRRLRYELTVE